MNIGSNLEICSESDFQGRVEAERREFEKFGEKTDNILLKDQQMAKIVKYKDTIMERSKRG